MVRSVYEWVEQIEAFLLPTHVPQDGCPDLAIAGSMHFDRKDSGRCSVVAPCCCSQVLIDLHEHVCGECFQIIGQAAVRMQVESHRENGLKSKRSLVYRYFATEDVQSVVQPLVVGQSQAHIPSATRIDSGASGAGAFLSSAAAAALAPIGAQGTGAACSKDAGAAGSEPAGADAQPSQGEAGTQAAGLGAAGSAPAGAGAVPSVQGQAATERGHGSAVEPKAKMNLNLVRQLRQDIITERLKETKIILRSEVRYLWHMYATEVSNSLSPPSAESAPQGRPVRL